ncbi:MAG: leucine--tRNA ligase [Bacteroidetes bacterium]|jgi:leucyl-tRNA synthetase|nr:leucine--tRNA ligase [Bacteroidota bacterium]
MDKYNYNEIEKKWQEFWAKNKTFKASNKSDKPKFYVLDMFPYPSGAGLHVGHPLGYIASDIYARYMRHRGFNVLHPMGYDSFGLPAEQYAIQTGQHPAKTTEVNILRYREQMDKIGFSFDWDREVRTSDPEYYRWTQWIFLKLFDSWYDNEQNKARPIEELIAHFANQGNEKINAASDEDAPVFTASEWSAFDESQQQEILLKYRLTYLAETEVNWCAELGTVLANDEVVNGVSERGGYPVVRKKMKQWIMRITAYAHRLLNDLDKIDWPQPLKDSQTNWIGKSKGAIVEFAIQNSSVKIPVFTTRPDTIFGVSFMVLAPEHEAVLEITAKEQKEEVEKYIEATAKRSERDRLSDVKKITGVFTGAYAEHPFTGEKIPVWIGDYVLASYGTGAVMGVPAGDQRDYDFAKHFKLPIPAIFKDVDISEEAFSGKENSILINSDFLNGMSYAQAMEKIIAALEAKGVGKEKINYRLRDAVFSRQRYWGEPFPIYYKNGTPYPIPETSLPLQLPEVEKYLPTETGEPPLGRAAEWAWDERNAAVVDNKKIDNKIVFPLELNTMPGWAGSSWYFFRYMEDEKRAEVFASPEALNYWKNVDLYIGGSEHATGHLLYSRFWVKFLYDRGLVAVDEPFKKLINQGMILGESAFIHRVEGENRYVSDNIKEQYKTYPIHVDVNFVNVHNELDVEAFKGSGSEFENAEFIFEKDRTFKVSREVEKMSKSKFNVVNPDDICEQYGADTLRMYEMFLGPLEQSKPWNTAGITGVHGFLKKLWKLYHSGTDGKFLISEKSASKPEMKVLHKTIKKVQEDIEAFSFNTSVSTFMIAVNELSALKCNAREVLEPFLILISPYAPHIAEELWHKIGHNESISNAAFPTFNESYLTEDEKEYPISFNGKMRFTLKLPLEMSKDEVESAVMSHEKTQHYLEGKSPKKIIVVPGKIVNIVH